MRRLISLATLAVGCLVATGVSAQQFTYKPAGQLESGTQGRPTSKVWVPQMRFPVLKAPAYANSQVWGHGGYKGPGGGQCDQANYSYPWYDNYCEPRQWDMPLCPGGTGHQGQDIRPKTCSDAQHWAVAAEAGTIIDDSGTAIKLKTPSGRTHRYLHLAPSTVVVDVGDELEPGDKIGKISNYTGGEYPTTIHLHYDVRQYVKKDPKSGDPVEQVAYFQPYTSLVESYKRLIGQTAGQYAAEMEVRYLNGNDRYKGGNSRNVPDYFPGETIRAAVYLKNAGRQPWPTTSYINYWFESPFLRATSYRIDTDHPAHDQSSWMRNSADSADQNPARDGLGQSGELLMHAFSAQETKRVKLKLKAKKYSIGLVDHPDVRAWIHRIEDLYGTQTGFFTGPSDRNAFGKTIRDFAELDVLSRDHWHFEGSESNSLEGWSPGDEASRVKINTKDGLITQKITHGDAQLISPAWTQIDADRWGELVLRLRSHDGPHSVALYWAGSDRGFSPDRKVEFEALGDGQLNTYVVPLDAHDGWRRTVTRFRVDLLEGNAPAGEDRKWYGIADLYFQSADDKQANSKRASFVEQPAVPISGASGDTTSDPDKTDAASPDPAGDDTDSGGAGRETANSTSTVSGCAQATDAPFGRPTGLGLLIVVLCTLRLRNRD